MYLQIEYSIHFIHFLFQKYTLDDIHHFDDDDNNGDTTGFYGAHHIWYLFSVFPITFVMASPACTRLFILVVSECNWSEKEGKKDQMRCITLKNKTFDVKLHSLEKWRPEDRRLSQYEQSESSCIDRELVLTVHFLFEEFRFSTNFIPSGMTANKFHCTNRWNLTYLAQNIWIAAFLEMFR